MTPVSGRVVYRSPPGRVYAHLLDGVREHTVDGSAVVASSAGRVLTRYETKLWFGTVVTTEEAAFEPDRAITWRHLDGPLTGSVESFHIEPQRDGGTAVRYEGQIRARHPVFRGPLERWFVAPTTKRVSLGALERARSELDG